MISRIKLENFKAHIDLELNLKNQKNILLYGENGAGKSSIYEALKVFFFKNRMLESLNLQVDIPSRRAQINEYFKSFNNTVTNDDFLLKVNNITTKGDEQALENENSFHLSMLNYQSTIVGDTVNLNILFEREFLDFNKSQVSYNEVEVYVNNKLNDFIEEYSIKIESNGDLKLIDNEKGLEDKRLTKFFNEGKVNLALLLIYFCIIKLYSKTEGRNILVLDDFITSLDISNRTFLIKYILEEFSNFQIFIFTHNIYFYNLINYIVTDLEITEPNDWSIFNLYETSRGTKVYEKKDRLELGSREKEASIVGRFEKLKENGENQNDSFQSLGNDIRKKFERLLYEFSKLLSIGAVEESNKILESLLKKNYAVLNHEKILDLLNQNQSALNKFNELKITNFLLIKDILYNLKAFRKIMMHPLSHSSDLGEPSYVKKEIENSISLLRKLENNLKDLIGKKVEGA